jgi:hypothetical protein
VKVAESRPTASNIGAAGEALVAARLLARGIDVAKPFSDNGVDLVAYSCGFDRAIPIQVKTASSPQITLERKWFAIPGIVLVYVWLVGSAGRFFVLDGLPDAEMFLGTSAIRDSWRIKGKWSISSNNFGQTHLDRLSVFEDAWQKITARLRA